MNHQIQAFLEQHRKYQDLFTGKGPFLPAVVRNRSLGFGAFLPDFNAGVQRAAAQVRPGDDRSHHGLALLAAVWLATGERNYVAQARQYCLDWLAAHPLESMEKEPRRHMDTIVHGLYGWLGPLHVFLECPEFDEATAVAVLGSARGQLALLHENLYPNRNLLFSYSVSLLANGLRLGHLPEAAAWLRRAVQVINDGCRRQINPDGSHMEATPHYHYCTMGDILNAFRHARLVPELGLEIPADRVASLYDYLAAATSPTGWVTGIHDGQPGARAALHGRGVADVLAERAAFRAELGLPEKTLPAIQLFPHAGQAFLRDRWDADATYLSFESSPCRSYHWHHSRNSIQLHAFGRLLLPDPGRFSYRDREWQDYATSTPAHSTLNLNGWNQVGTPPVLRLRRAPGFVLAEGLYSGGYWESEHRNGIFAEHHRTLLWLPERGFALVIDHLLCPSREGAKPRLESVWQLGDGGVSLDPAGRRAMTTHPDANLLLLFPLQADGTEMRLRCGETAPRRGWLPDKFETDFIPAPQVVLETGRVENWNADLATVLIPYRGAAAPAVEAVLLRGPEQGASFHKPGHGRLLLRWGDGGTDEFRWRRRLETALGEHEDLLTDGSLIHLRRDAGGNIRDCLVADGSMLRLTGGKNLKITTLADAAATSLNV